MVCSLTIIILFVYEYTHAQTTAVGLDGNAMHITFCAVVIAVAKLQYRTARGGHIRTHISDVRAETGSRACDRRLLSYNDNMYNNTCTRTLTHAHTI